MEVIFQQILKVSQFSMQGEAMDIFLPLFKVLLEFLSLKKPLYSYFIDEGIDGFAVLEREGDNKYLFSFIIGKGEGNIDEVTHTDGIAVTSASLGPGFPNGGTSST